MNALKDLQKKGDYRIDRELALPSPGGVVTNRNAKTMLFFLSLMHDVLICLHVLSRKYAMPWHPDAFLHDFLHSSRLQSFPGELFKYASPALSSHSA